MTVVRVLLALLCYAVAMIGIPAAVFTGMIGINRLTCVLLSAGWVLLVMVGACIAPSDTDGAR